MAPPEARRSGGLLAPAAERGHELLLGLGRDGLGRDVPEGDDRHPHLLDVEGAGVALGDVLLEPGPGVVVHLALEIVGHELDHLLAGQHSVLTRGHRVASSGCGFKWSSSAARTFERARCRSTRWFVSLRSRALRTSSASQPLMSRSVITSRWR